MLSAGNVTLGHFGKSLILAAKVEGGAFLPWGRPFRLEVGVFGSCV